MVMTTYITFHKFRRRRLWWKSALWKRIIRGILAGGFRWGIYEGFDHIDTDSSPNYYMLQAASYFFCGVTIFGVLPYVFDLLKLNRRTELIEDDDEYQELQGIRQQTYGSY
mmetsp:Transcript_19283/g.21844  ORF Transcript_19283/g.21844 Transcript_19283/m.21844 type:complete len:111 (+) Transcript_19283:1-333(+)